MSISKGQFITLTVVLAAATMGTAGYLAYSAANPSHGNAAQPPGSGTAVDGGAGTGTGSSPGANGGAAEPTGNANANGGGSGGSGGATDGGTGSAAPADCRGDQITVSLGGNEGGAGHISVVVIFQNTGQAACILKGYPGAEVVDSTDAYTEDAKRTLTGYMGGAPSTAVTVDPGGYASAMVEWSDASASSGSAGCVTTSILSATPPNTKVTSQLPLSSPAEICSSFQVHPVVAGQKAEGKTG